MDGSNRPVRVSSKRRHSLGWRRIQMATEFSIVNRELASQFGNKFIPIRIQEVDTLVCQMIE